MDPHRIRLKLQHAFRRRPRPEPNELVASDVLHPEAAAVSSLLARKDRWELTTSDIRDVLTSELWMLTPSAFHYYLPALLTKVLEDYRALSVFANEVVDALIRPEAADADLIHERLGMTPSAVPCTAASSLNELYNSGWPEQLFLDRFGTLSHEEGEAVLSFILAFREAHGADFPFDELDVAILRHWHRFAAEASPPRP
jgi:hypothetical protein